jgi:hypothetical protein
MAHGMSNTRMIKSKMKIQDGNSRWRSKIEIKSKMEIQNGDLRWESKMEIQYVDPKWRSNMKSEDGEAR